MTQQPPRTAVAPPTILQLAFPTILGNLLFSLVTMVQTKFVGELGSQAVAAVGAGQRVFFTVQALFMAISIGTTALVARAWGANQRQEAAHVLTASMVLSAATAGILLLIGLLFSDAIARVFGLDKDTTTAAASNIQWLCVFAMGFAINIVLGGALRAAGNAWTPLIFVALANVLNVPAQYIFIFGYGLAPRMEAAGAAFATGLTITVVGIILVALWYMQRLTIRFDGSQWLDRDRYSRLIHIGFPAAMEQMIIQIGMFVFLTLVGHHFGTEAFAAFNVGLNLLNVALVVGFGFSIAGSAIVGQNLGAGDFKAARRSGWRAAKWAVASMSPLALITVVYAEPLARFFLGADDVTVRHTVEFTYIMALCLPMLAIEFAIGGSLRGAGDTRFPLMVTAFGLVVLRCGLAVLFISWHLPVVWVYSTMIFDFLFKAAMLIWRFRSGRWRHAIPSRIGAETV